MAYQLRPYQLMMSDAMVKAFLDPRDRPVIVQAATGAGKSLVIADVCHRLDAPVLILQPSKELTEQNYDKLKSYGITDISIYSASLKSKEVGKYTYATIGSIYRKPELFKHFKYIIVDECDVVNPKAMTGMYQKFFEAIGCRNVVGLTATPYRMDMKYEWDHGNLYSSAVIKMINRIGNPCFWRDIIFKIETDTLIELGYLSPIKYHIDSEELRGLVVNTTGSDYTTLSLERWGDEKVSKIADYVEWIDPKCTRSLTFCTGVAQADKLKELLHGRGIASDVVTALTPAKERERIVSEYKSGKIRHLLNVGVFLAGFDVPELDCIIFARPTLSLRIWYQAVGRGVRLDPARPDKVLRVIDMARAVQKMGRVETIKLGKEPDGFRDLVRSEAGRMDNRVLFSFKVPKKGAKR